MNSPKTFRENLVFFDDSSDRPFPTGGVAPFPDCSTATFDGRLEHVPGKGSISDVSHSPPVLGTISRFPAVPERQRSHDSRCHAEPLFHQVGATGHR